MSVGGFPGIMVLWAFPLPPGSPLQGPPVGNQGHGGPTGADRESLGPRPVGAKDRRGGAPPLAGLWPGWLRLGLGLAGLS